MASRECPSCRSKRIWKDGVRETNLGLVQRFFCRDCSFRFSEKSYKESFLSDNSQLCAIYDVEAKKLDTATEIKTVAGERKKPLKFDLLPENMRGHIVQLTAYLERNGFDEDTTYPAILTRLVSNGANLLDLENVKSVIAKRKKANGEPWSDSMKVIAVSAYDAFYRMEKITWERPKYRQSEVEIIAPDEKDLDALISNASKRFATLLQCLKETFADPSEILAVEWTEFKENVIYINHPVKRHYSVKYELSPKLVGMINALSRENKRIFPTNYRFAANCMRLLRSKTAAKLNNPALLQISLKSFRHWGRFDARICY